MPEVRACGQEVHMDKIIRLQQAMPSDMEAAILQDAANRFYLTGMKSSAGTVLVTRNKAWLIIDFRYFEEAEEKVKNCRVIEEKNLYSQIKQLLEAEGIFALSLHTGLVTLEKYRQLETALKGISLDVSDSLSGLMDSLRREKDEEEIACHKKAQQITDHTFSHILGIIKPGLTEIDVAREIGVTLTRLGSDDKNFNFIVASGPNSSLPHGFATSRLIQKGDFVTMDFGAVVDGYHSDMTRTIAVGFATEKMEEVYGTVLKAQKAGISALCPGERCSEADKICRDIITEAGYGEFFTHSTGHGVGLDIHEFPNLSPLSPDVLEKGNVVTVEPGIYIPGEFGVRIEDFGGVTSGDFQNFTESKKELIIL